MKSIKLPLIIKKQILPSDIPPGTKHEIVGVITDKGTYTIVEISGKWGKLKSGAGWIHLNYTKKV